MMSTPFVSEEPQSQDAAPLGVTKAQVENIADQFAAIVGYEPGSDIEPLVKMMGGRIEYQDVESACNTGSIEVFAPDNFTINISPFSAGTRSRFTIAHELGHFALHSEFGKKPIKIRRDGTGRIEWEANWFAAEFLMPRTKFVEDIIAGLSNAELALKYGVSEKAAEVRRNSL